ncbi:PAS domain S-box protein [Nostoc sp. PCC 7107]|uniref:PAS domain S-box protein n=1 Tax=Nostoc sp. PCC 7107 TaxID=317936 RepID=UPI00029EEA22|nr:PAS domain S-box protein [Nostoc sp. PCC 7107]AFY41045.1 multi-sensor hybrid histidine kinase [Nostoc sp. PCC 7107]
MPLQNQLINWPNLYHLINHDPLTINPDSYLVDAIILMSQKQAQSLSLSSLDRYFKTDICNQQKNSCILVVEAGYLLGIITAKDVLNIIAAGVNITQTKVAEVMVTALITLRQSYATDIFTAWSLLRHYQISYLPIVDNQGKLTGIVTDSILLQAFNRDIIVGIKTACQQTKKNYRKINGISCSIHHHLQPGIEQKSSTFLSTHQEFPETRKKLQMVEEKLHQTQDELEKLVAENQRLQQKIFEYQQAEIAWQNREKLYCQQKEESLRESEARLSLALEAADMGIWDWKLQTDETLWSANMGLLYGLADGTACPTKEDFLELIHPEDRQAFTQAVTATIQQGVKFVVEYRAVWPDSSIHWLNSTGQLYYNEDGQPSRLTGTTRDISEQQAALRERKQAEQKILEQAALLDIVTDAIVVRDLQNRILFWNQGAEHLYGWSEQEAVDQNADELLFKQPSAKILAAIEKVIDSGTWQGELHKVTKFGTEIIVASRWTLMQDSTGKPQSILIVDTDITQKKQLEEQCFRTQRLESLGTLAGGIAHDLNNILTPILAASQLLQLKFSQDTDHYYQLMAIIENNAKRGADLVKQVLSFARGFKGERTIILIKHLISEMLLIAKQTFPKSIEFAIAIPDNLLAVSGDVTQLHQVLMNLVVNARDAMPDGGKIAISAENRLIDEAYAQMNLDAQAGHYIELTVADNGMGMSPEILDRIFEPFFTTKDMGTGTGLGLSTVLGIIKSHGGFINVSSKVGKGTKFKLFLPAIEGRQVIKSENLVVPLGEGELILVVDDEAKILEIATIVLENYNYKILTASNGIEAIALYAQHKHQIKAVLMDMIMPEMDGMTAIRTLQKMNPQVQIIACSGFNHQENLTEVVNANIQLVLPKPFTAQDLLNSLQHVLRNQN